MPVPHRGKDLAEGPDDNLQLHESVAVKWSLAANNRLVLTWIEEGGPHGREADASRLWYPRDGTHD
jgi:hypothetical protein